MKNTILVLSLLVMVGCDRLRAHDPMLDKSEMKMLAERCTRQHTYWNIHCYDLASKYRCSGTAWTGESTRYGKHTAEWESTGTTAEEVATSLASMLDTPGNPHTGDTTYDSGIQECKPKSGGNSAK